MIEMTVADHLAAQIVPAIENGFQRLSLSTTPWASASFSGHRHRLILTSERPLDRRSERRLSAVLADHEFELSSAIVADAHLARVSPDGRTIAVDLLTVND